MAPFFRLLTFDTPREDLRNLGLLVLRVSSATLMCFGHGVPKLFKLLEGGTFADPLGLGPQVSLFLATFAEVACALMVAAGLLTRLSCLPLIVTMLVAAAIVHGADPWAKKEFALLYLIPFAVLLLTGPGRWSVDALIHRRGSPSREQ